MIRIDTHVVVWLYTGELDRFSNTARQLLDTQPAVASPMVQLELTYLHEIGRLTVGGADIIGDLTTRMGLTLSDQPLLSVVQSAASLSWTRDPFDRLIVGDALAAGTQLVTKDDTIRQHASVAVW